MRTSTKFTFSVCIVLALGVGHAVAGAKPDQVHRLSEDLTPMGSERAGNADGTIPEWTDFRMRIKQVSQGPKAQSRIRANRS